MLSLNFKKLFEPMSAHSLLKTHVNACLQCGRPLCLTQSIQRGLNNAGIFYSNLYNKKQSCSIAGQHTRARTLMELSNGLPIIIVYLPRASRRRTRTHATVLWDIFTAAGINRFLLVIFSAAAVLLLI